MLISLALARLAVIFCISSSISLLWLHATDASSFCHDWEEEKEEEVVDLKSTPVLSVPEFRWSRSVSPGPRPHFLPARPSSQLLQLPSHRLRQRPATRPDREKPHSAVLYIHAIYLGTPVLGVRVPQPTCSGSTPSCSRADLNMAASGTLWPCEWQDWRTRSKWPPSRHRWQDDDSVSSSQWLANTAVKKPESRV